jgi:cyclopropane-fatty-acyl-phospholipid synthase
MVDSPAPMTATADVVARAGSRAADGRTQARTGAYRGSSAEAVQHHYDVGNEFYSLWLDPTLTYTCALWDDDARDTLEAAQLRKLDYHAAQARVGGARRVLDIGCGWGSMLRRMVEAHGVERAVGVTLSRAQTDYVARLGVPGVEVRFENWFDHRPAQPYDAIISICAIEHAARLGLVRRQRVAAYRTFFRHCHALLAPGRRMSLQTMAYGAGAAFAGRAGALFGRLGPRRIDRILHAAREHPRLGAAAARLLGALAPIPGDLNGLDALDFAVVFEEATLPTLVEIAEGADGLFEIETLRNDREQYARTGREWLRRFQATRAECLALVGEDRVARYERYLGLVPRVFDSGAAELLRITFRRVGSA